jgi:hypothetical protein
LDYKKLKDILEENAIQNNRTIQDILGLIIEDSKITAVLRDDPRCYFSTMGCRTSNGADINFINEYAL